VADGWAVEVIMRTDEDGESKRTFYAHIPDSSAAEQAVAKRVGAIPDVRVEARARVPHATFVEKQIAEGEVA
jgi:hypothetical protein